MPGAGEGPPGDAQIADVRATPRRSRGGRRKPRHRAGAASLFQTVPARSQERLPGCARGRGSCRTPVDAVRSDKDRRATGFAGVTSRAVSPDQQSDSCDQSDSRLSLGARHPGPAGTSLLRKQLPQLLAARADVLSPRMMRIIEDLMADWTYLDERIKRVTDEIEALARADEGCHQLITVPGIGPIISSAMVAAIGNGAAIRITARDSHSVLSRSARNSTALTAPVPTSPAAIVMLQSPWRRRLHRCGERTRRRRARQCRSIPG